MSCKSLLVLYGGDPRLWYPMFIPCVISLCCTENDSWWWLPSLAETSRSIQNYCAVVGNNNIPCTFSIGTKQGHKFTFWFACVCLFNFWKNWSIFTKLRTSHLKFTLLKFIVSNKSWREYELLRWEAHPSLFIKIYTYFRFWNTHIFIYM
jgi:hypothetical protein